MSRVQKAAVFVSLAIVAFLCAGAVLWQIVEPRIAYSAGSPEIQPVSPWGWTQLVASALAGVGLTGAGVWQAVATFMESHLPGFVQRIMPGASARTITSVVDFGKITALKGLTATMPDGPAKDALAVAGRACCDELRDGVFPLPVA